MTTTPNLGLPYIDAAQAQKHVTHNEAIRGLDALVQTSILTRALSAPPATPADGACYIVAAAASGAWAGQPAGTVAAWQDGIWVFYPPKVGWLAWVADEATTVNWTGTLWQTFGSPSSLPQLGVNATPDATNKLSVNSAAVLLNNIGNSVQLKLNKHAVADTASVLFQDGFSGRAEIGLTGDDGLHIKVSADGSAWSEALKIDAASGLATLKGDPVAALGIATKQYVDAHPGTPGPAGATGPAGPVGGAPGQLIYNNAGAAGGVTIGGDASLNTAIGALTVTKTNGTSFSSLATGSAPVRAYAALTFPAPADNTVYFVPDAPAGPSLCLVYGGSYRLRTLSDGVVAWQVTLRNPTATDDTTKGWAVGDTWVNTFNGVLYQATAVTANAAVWKQIVPPALPLDAIAGAAAAYGVVKLRAAYAGNAFQVKRASDSTTFDIGFDAGGAALWANAAAFGSGTTLTVTKWYDQSGNGLDMTSAGAASDPVQTLANKIGTRTAIDIGGTQYWNLPAGLSLNRQAFSAAIVSRQCTSENFPARFTLGAAVLGATSEYLGFYQNGQVLVNSAGSGVFLGPGGVHLDQSVMIGLFGASNITITIDDRSLSTSTVGAAATLTGGVVPNPNYPFKGQYGALIFYGSTLTTANAALLKQALVALFGLPTQVRDRLVFVGDSLTAGYMGADNMGFAQTVQGQLTRPYQVCNLGIGGTTMASETAATYTAFAISGAKNVAHVFSGTNDIGFGGTAAALQTTVQTLCTALKAGGFNKVIVGTLLPRNSLFSGGQTGAGFETARLAYNTWLRTNYATFADALADYGADATLGNVANVNNTAWFADAVHPTDAGHAILKGICAATLNGLG